jgi:hypothetical protein
MNTHGYTCRVTNWKLFGLLAALCVVPLAVWAVVPRHPVGLLVCAVVLALVSVVFSSVGLAVGPRGVTVRLGPVGWPAARIARERITDARAVTLPATKVGGWGLHYSPWRGGRLIVRSGPALRLQLAGGGTLTISAEDPAAAVRVLDTQP